MSEPTPYVEPVDPPVPVADQITAALADANAQMEYWRTQREQARLMRDSANAEMAKVQTLVNLLTSFQTLYQNQSYRLQDVRARLVRRTEQRDAAIAERDARQKIIDQVNQLAQTAANSSTRVRPTDIFAATGYTPPQPPAPA